MAKNEFSVNVNDLLMSITHKNWKHPQSNTFMSCSHLLVTVTWITRSMF